MSERYVDGGSNIPVRSGWNATQRELEILELRKEIAALKAAAASRPEVRSEEDEIEQLARDMQCRVSGSPRGSLLYDGYLKIARVLREGGADGLLTAIGAAQASRPRAFLAWAVQMFGPVAKLRSERLLRFVEEAIELAHAEGMEREVFNKVADRVYSRPAGDTPKEIGQAQACLEIFAENIGLSSTDEAAREWTRVQEIPQEEWTRRHAAKQALGIALPSASRGTEA